MLTAYREETVSSIFKLSVIRGRQKNLWKQKVTVWTALLDRQCEHIADQAHIIKSHFYIFSYIYIENEYIYIYSVFYEYNEEDKI